MILPTYILAGGQSRRFGSDKARATLNGEPLIVRLSRQLKGFASEVIVVADRADKYADLGLKTIADRVPGQGPLGGLEAALMHAGEREDSGWILVVSCDLVDVREDWINVLMSDRGEESLARAFHDQFWYPFPGFYHSGSIPLIEEYLASSKASFQRLLSDPRMNTARLSLPDDWPTVAQVNTPEDFERVKGKG